MLTIEQKIAIAKAITDSDQAKGLIESLDLPDDSFDEVIEFLETCFVEIETKIYN